MQTLDQQYDELRGHAFFNGMSESEWSFLLAHFDTNIFESGESIINEGESNSDIYFIISGEAELLKSIGATENAVIGKVSKGAVLGELSFLDDSPRSVSVRTTSTATLITLPKNIFEKESEESHKIYSHLVENIALLGSRRLKDTNQDYVDSLTREVDLLREQINFGSMFIIMVLLFGLNGVILGVIQSSFSQYYHFDGGAYNYVYERIISWTGFLIFALPVFYLIKVINFPVREVLDLRPNWKKSLGESLAISFVIIIPILLLTFDLLPVDFGPRINPDFSALHLLYVASPDYLLHSYIQEFVARGIMQNSIQRFLRDEKGTKTVFVSSFAFAVMHAHLGPTMAIGTGIGSLIFGFLYLRHKNLLGITVIHYLLGGFVMRFVRFIGTI